MKIDVSTLKTGELKTLAKAVEAEGVRRKNAGYVVQGVKAPGTEGYVFQIGKTKKGAFVSGSVGPDDAVIPFVYEAGDADGVRIYSTDLTPAKARKALAAAGFEVVK